MHNFTYSSAPLTDLIKKTNPWRWTNKGEGCFQELNKKMSSTNRLGAPCPKDEIILFMLQNGQACAHRCIVDVLQVSENSALDFRKAYLRSCWRLQ